MISKVVVKGIRDGCTGEDEIVGIRDGGDWMRGQRWR